ncbi:16256_t:CDS:2, partial [Cetraspora pellucida]
ISGWSLVYLLRRPSFFLLSKLVKVKISTSGILTLLLIGFIEEFVRLVWLYYAHEDASTGNNSYQEFLIAYWLGLGWATAEAIYFIIQNFIEIRWYKEEAGLNGQYAEERRELEEILGRPLTKVSAWWAFESTLVYPAAIIHGLLHVVWGYCLPVFGIPKDPLLDQQPSPQSYVAAILKINDSQTELRISKYPNLRVPCFWNETRHIE